MLLRRRVAAGAPWGPPKGSPGSCWLKPLGAHATTESPTCNLYGSPVSPPERGMFWRGSEGALTGGANFLGGPSWGPLQPRGAPRKPTIQRRGELLPVLMQRFQNGPAVRSDARGLYRGPEHQEGKEQQQDDEEAELPPVRLSRVVVLNKITRFEVSLAEKMAAWRRQHLSRSGNSRRSESPSDQLSATEHAEDPSLYTPGSKAYEAAAAAAEAQAAAALARDFPSAYKTHVLHQKTAAEVYRQLRESYGLHVTVIKARTMQGIVIAKRGAAALPPDAVISAGGDGTYLEAASIIPGKATGETSGPWLFGINTDPSRSEGRLCVKSPYKTVIKSDKPQQKQQQQNQVAAPTGAVHSLVAFETPRVPGPPFLSSKGQSQGPPVGAPATGAAAFDARGYIAATLKHLLQGGSRVIARQRIRATLRFPAHMKQEVTAKLQQKQEDGRGLKGPPPLEGLGPAAGSAAPGDSPAQAGGIQSGGLSWGPLLGPLSSISGSSSSAFAGGHQAEGNPSRGPTFDSAPHRGGGRRGRNNEDLIEIKLPFLAVNDVLVSEANVAKTLYADVWIDGQTRRHKSSGILVSTGTGSSAWHFNMGCVCKEQTQAVAEEVMKQIPSLREASPLTDSQLEEVMSAANARLLLDPGAPIVRFRIREPIENRIFSCDRTMGVAQEVRVKPLAGEVIVSMDGLAELPLPPLVEIVLSVDPRDALWTAE